MEIVLTINGKVFIVSPSSVPIETSLNTFIRDYAKLSGTKFMCLEGGCGVCVVTVRGIHPVTKVKSTWAANSVNKHRRATGVFLTSFIYAVLVKRLFVSWLGRHNGRRHWK